MRCKLLCIAVLASAARADTFVFSASRAGAYPSYPGNGWLGEAFLDIPEEYAVHLVVVESYIADRTPDFTFRTDWIDFPAGPASLAPYPDPALDEDADFPTVGDFLNDYVLDVSDPSMLDRPFCNLLIRFKGFLKVSLADGTQSYFGLPVWVDFATYGHDGYRTWVAETIYRQPRQAPANNLVLTENGIFFGLGLFPIEISSFSRYDPGAELGYDRAGIELYSWHGGGMAWPAGAVFVHPQRGPMTLVPPEHIYQSDDIVALAAGDFEADGDVDEVDFRWFGGCTTGPGGLLSILNCDTFDGDHDGDVDLADVAAVQRGFRR
ncbi:MAG: hypothetical protein HY763_00300 [Planctomycetes bacterium]|nr:hypothetical protein [Planctomycetota bacterium]